MIWDLFVHRTAVGTISKTRADFFPWAKLEHYFYLVPMNLSVHFSFNQWIISFHKSKLVRKNVHVFMISPFTILFAFFKNASNELYSPRTCLNSSDTSNNSYVTNNVNKCYTVSYSESSVIGSHSYSMEHKSEATVISFVLF